MSRLSGCAERSSRTDRTRRGHLDLAGEVMSHCAGVWCVGHGVAWRSDPEETRRAEGGRIEPNQQAHLLQGIEAQILLAVLRAYWNDIHTSMSYERIDQQPA